MNIKNWIIHKLGGITKDELFNEPLVVKTQTVNVKNYKVDCMLTSGQSEQITEAEIKKQLYKKIANEMFLNDAGEFYSDVHFDGSRVVYTLFVDIAENT